MPNHKLLVIGAGIGQVPLLKKAKKRGIRTCVVTLPDGQPGTELADEVFFCDIFDREAIVLWAKNHEVTAVISDQNDLMNPTVAYVAEKLGLPGNRLDQVISYCNKNRFRENCDRIGLPSPGHIAVNSTEEDLSSFSCPFPWIVKPADSQSSVGVYKIENKDELNPALACALACSRSHSAIIEAYFEGKEIVCEGFIEDGQYHLLAFADRQYFSSEDESLAPLASERTQRLRQDSWKPCFIPSRTMFPSLAKPELLERILECERQMAEYIQPSFGIVHSEYLINEETNEICVVESALRGGGVYISSHLIPLATGIDVNEILLDKALGTNAELERKFAARKEAATGYMCFYLPEGTIRSVGGLRELNELSFVKMACLDDIRIGDKTEPMLHKGMRKGPILVAGANREELEEKMAEVRRILKIDVEGPDGVVRGILWD